MLGAMVESTAGMLENLEKVVDSGGGSAEVEMEKLLETTTADIISRTAFGSSYKKGTRVFEEQRNLYRLLAAKDPLLSIPLFRFKSSHPHPPPQLPSFRCEIFSRSITILIPTKQSRNISFLFFIEIRINFHARG